MAWYIILAILQQRILKWGDFMSKIRRGFVTNSSSSSFIISRNAVTKDKLKEILLEIANEEKKYDDWYDDQRDENGNVYNKDDIIGDIVAHRYIITEIIGKGKFADWDDYEYEDVYYIDNESCMRYDWDAVDDILSKYDIDWHRGYCD